MLRISSQFLQFQETVTISRFPIDRLASSQVDKTDYAQIERLKAEVRCS
jgi:hypothetical protein